MKTEKSLENIIKDSKVNVKLSRKIRFSWKEINNINLIYYTMMQQIYIDIIKYERKTKLRYGEGIQIIISNIGLDTEKFLRAVNKLRNYIYNDFNNYLSVHDNFVTDNKVIFICLYTKD